MDRFDKAWCALPDRIQQVAHFIDAEQGMGPFAQQLVKMRGDNRTGVNRQKPFGNRMAQGIATTLNNAQTNGAALDGTTGTALISGSGAGGMTLALTDPAGWATAPAGSAAGSRDGANLAALRTTLDTLGPAGLMNAVVVDISSAVAGRTVTRDALQTIADTARNAMETQAGVDLDQEAVNLVRYQQIFQASGRAMQVASDMLDTLLAIR